MNHHLIAPSILAADFSNLGRAVEMLNRSQADWIHVDMMDGHFVPNISIGFPALKAIKAKSTLPLDVHIMFEQPALWIQRFADAGAYSLSIHAEASTNLEADIASIHDAGLKAGIALNPDTPLNRVNHVLMQADMILIMSVNPGFGGQSFKTATFEKVNQLRRLLDANHHQALIEVDGGVDAANAIKLLDAGADVLVAGSSIFKAVDAVQMIKTLKELSSDNLTDQ